MIRQIVLNCIANNDIKIVRYTCPQYLQDPINKFLYLYSGRELLLRNACMLLNGQCEKSRVPPKNELTSAVTKSNHPDPNQLSLAKSTTRQLEAVAQRWIYSNCFTVRHENGVFHFRYNAAIFHTICIALIK